ncbi:hypothetical protein LCGC14_2183170, partial [marine sediment metagenome]
VGNEWMKAIKLEATILAVNELNDRLEDAEATLLTLQAEIATLQAQNPASLQPQIDAINVKLANVSIALQ